MVHRFSKEFFGLENGAVKSDKKLNVETGSRRRRNSEKNTGRQGWLEKVWLAS